MKDRVSVLIEPLLLELDATPRLRWGVYIILVLFFIWLQLVISDERAVLENEYWQLQENEAEFLELDTADTWQQRLDEEQAYHDRLIMRTWSGGSVSVISATLQTALRQMMLDAGMERSSVLLGDPQDFDTENGITRIRVRLRGNYTGNAALDLVATIEKSEPALVIERLKIDAGTAPGRPGQFNADVLAYLKTGAAARD